MMILAHGRRVFAIVAVAAALALGSTANAAIEDRVFDDPSLTDRYQDLIAELRCLVCQNQNLADSDAELARDLRDKTAEMLIAGKTNKEILSYMSDRYGDFVLYRPPVRSDTALLWFGPIILLLLVLIFVYRHVRSKQSINPAQVENESDHAERERVRALLKDTPNLD